MTVDPRVPPGWYADPAGRHRFRFWDGSSWTPGVSDGSAVGEEPLPPVPPALGHDERARLPARAAALGIAGLLLGAVVGIGSALGLDLVDGLPRVVPVVVAQVLLWAGMVGACVVASRRFGTGSLRRDYGLRFRRSDIGWGLLLAFVARLVAGVVVVVLVGVDERLGGSNLPEASELRSDIPVLVAFSLMAVVGAPVIEELFFRGLLLQSLIARLRTGGAIPVQALLFGAVHAVPTSGLGNVSVLVATFSFGLLAGGTVLWKGRLGTTIVGHALFNVVAVVGLLFVL